MYLEAEKDPSGQLAAKKMCLQKEMPLSIYIENKALIEAITIQNNEPVYGVIHNLMDPMNDGELMSWAQVQSKFDFTHSRIYYGNGNIVDKTSQAAKTQPNVPGQMLLIPESSNDRVMAFNAVTGDLINADFIPADAPNLSTPIAAIKTLDGTDNYLVSDQISDAIQRYDGSGGFVNSLFAGNTAILDNVRGINYNKNFNQILATVGSGPNSSAIPAFDHSSGNYMGNFIAAGAGGLNSPFDILYQESFDRYLVGGNTSDAVHTFDANGNSTGIFATINTFPEQITEFPDGRIALANFSGTQEGIMIFSSTGTLMNVLDPPGLGGYRGVYELGNGNLLVTNGSGVHEIDYTGTLINTKMAGVSARFIHESKPAAAIPTLSEWGVGILFLVLLIFGLVMIRSISLTNSYQNT